MTTKMRRGRDPEQHVVHTSVAQANAFKGLHGELTFLADGAGAESPIIEIRAHDGLRYGGYSIPVTPAAAVPAPMPVARAVAPVPVTTTADSEAVVIAHELGYYPMVQVLKADGTPGVVTLEHHDAQSLTLVIATAGIYAVYLR